MPLETAILAELEALAEAGLLRAPRTISSAQGPELVIDGRSVLCFCSNNYLGLADHPDLRAAATAALASRGVGASASRLVSGSIDAHLDAERAFASFVQLPAAALFSTGYAANLGAIQALFSKQDVVFSDRLCHASLIDGCRLSGADVHIFRHTDAQHLAALLAEHRGRYRRALIVTDALFSMDGDSAPLPALRELADTHDAALLVDEAHSLGVLGPHGRGLCAKHDVVPDLLVGTLGKAFGCAGAFVAGSSAAIAYLQNRARSYVFSTAPAPAIVAAAIRATGLVLEADDRRAKLLEHAHTIRDGLRAEGFQVREDDSPIIPIILGDAARTMEASAFLLERGVFVQGIRPPSVPDHTSRLRLVPIATHSDAHISHALRALSELPWR